MGAFDPCEAAFEAALKGVHAGFQHLEIDQIRNPPHRWFDAALARQIAIHITVMRLKVPKRRVVEQMGRSREAVNRALRTIDERLGNWPFALCYDLFAAYAEHFHSNQFDAALRQSEGRGTGSALAATGGLVTADDVKHFRERERDLYRRATETLLAQKGETSPSLPPKPTHGEIYADPAGPNETAPGAGSRPSGDQDSGWDAP